MSAQNCQARLLFSNFSVKIDYGFSCEYNASPYVLKESLTGIWQQDLFVNFTKRELSCPSLLLYKKGKLYQQKKGWAHKKIDSPIVRNMNAGYPFPAFNSGIGYNYPASYFADQKYPNQEGYTQESVPLFENFRTRQEFIPLFNNQDSSVGRNGPFYYKITDPADPLNGHPPNWLKNLDDPEKKYIFALTPNNTVFDTKEDYTNWLATFLENLNSPVYYPGAPNDPKPDVTPRKIPTLFKNKSDWMNFLNNAGGKGVACGGVAQCGVDYRLYNTQEQGTLGYSGSIAETEGDAIEGTAIYKDIPTILSFVSGLGRIGKTNDDLLTEIDKNGNITFQTTASDSDVYQNISIGFAKFFNKKQKGCIQFKNALKKNSDFINSYYNLTDIQLTDSRNFYDKSENFEDVFGFAYQFCGAAGVVQEFKTTLSSETDNMLRFERSGNFQQDEIKVNLLIRYTLEWTDL